jgi:pyridoxal phosphate enzyme (YggS family)
LPIIDIISNIYRRMSHAAMRAGRDPLEVSLVAVSKTVDVLLIKEAYEAGLRSFGESRVKEAAEKAGELDFEGIEWHLVGHLQKNKAKAAVSVFDLIHSVDSVELMGLINRHAEQEGKVQRALIQVKLSEEESKSGAAEEEAGLLLRESRGMGNISIEGLMTIPPYFDDPNQARPYYRRLREIAEEIGLREISMGMTNDFEVAIEEGATIVRVGTAIFGEREYA